MSTVVLMKRRKENVKVIKDAVSEWFEGSSVDDVMDLIQEEDKHKIALKRAQVLLEMVLEETDLNVARKDFELCNRILEALRETM